MLVERVAAAVRAVAGTRSRTLVAIDGADCAGKTTLADALAGRLGPVAVRASVDGFHRPRAERTARGELSPEGCYRDSFDLDALRSALLAPFAAGAPEVCVAAFDHLADAAVDVRVPVPERAVLVVDGLFLLRPELREWWHLAVHLRVSDDTVLRRARRRDGEDALPRYRARYLPAQRLYRDEADPEGSADLVLDND